MAGRQLCSCRHSWSDLEALFSLHNSGDCEKGGVWKTVFVQLGIGGSREVMLVMLPLKAGKGPGADIWLSRLDPRTVITCLLQMRMMRLGEGK